MLLFVLYTLADLTRQDSIGCCPLLLTLMDGAQAVMVAWAQATIPAKIDGSQQPRPSGIESATLLGKNESAIDVVSRALAAISDPYVQLQSQTKNI